MACRLLVCDEDKSYMDALAAYFVSLNLDIDITMYTTLEGFLSDDSSYDLGMMSKDFINHIDDEQRSRIKKYIYLADGMDDSFEGMEVLYKFQQMSAFKKVILSMSGKRQKDNIKTNSLWVGITSPAHHELAGLFSMAYAKNESVGSYTGDVLFIDLDSNSILSELLENDGAKNITDYLYLLKGSGTDSDELKDCFSYYDSVTYLLPCKYYGETAGVSPEDWDDFFESIDSLAFKKIIVLFDDSLRGADNLLVRLKKLIVLNRQGDYYQKLAKKFNDYLQSSGFSIKPLNINLPLTAKNLDDGSYVVEQLLTGNLAKYVVKAGVK